MKMTQKELIETFEHWKQQAVNADVDAEKLGMTIEETVEKIIKLAIKDLQELK
jgi:hypothetical protein